MTRGGRGSAFNRRAVRRLCKLSVVAAPLAVAGCSGADSFGPRAMEYNEEAAASKSSQILLNIVRAAYRYPLQFTDLSTVTGQATASVTTGSSLPLFGNRATSARLFTFSPGFTFSGGPSFNIANLNSQEFYYGIQNPVDQKTILHYVYAGYDPYVLLPLFISGISTSDRVLRSAATGKNEYNTFYAALKTLIDYGLTMEPVDETRALSPPLTPAQAADPKLLSGLISASSAGTGTAPTLKRYSLSKGDDPNLPDSEKSSLGKLTSDTYYRLVKTSTSATFCFDRRKFKPFPNVDFRMRTPDSSSTELSVPMVQAGNDVLFPSNPNPLFCDEKPKKTESRTSKGTPGETIPIAEDMNITLRSVEEIFLFLGEMVRTELGIANGTPSRLEVLRHIRGDPLELFRVERRKPTPGEIAASFNGETFVVSADPSGTNTSTTVLQLLTDLVALNSSAKSLPTPNVIPFLSAP